MTALATQMRHFGLMSAMTQPKDDETKNATVPNDYRALVCIFLVGGNDGNNTVIPLHSDANLSNFQTYYALRNPQNLAFAQNVPLAIQVPRMSNLLYGFHPAFGVGNTNNGIYELWSQNKLAVVTNVGTLVKPTVRSQIYRSFASETLQYVFAFRPSRPAPDGAKRPSGFQRLGRTAFRSSHNGGQSEFGNSDDYFRCRSTVFHRRTSDRSARHRARADRIK